MNNTDEIHGLLVEALKLSRMAKFDEAKQLCDAQKVNDANSRARILRIRSIIAKIEGNYGQEERYLLQSVLEDPSSRASHSSIMCHYTRVGKFNEAIAESEIIIALDCEQHSILFTDDANMYAAYCNFKLQNYAKAKELLRKCTAIDDCIPISGAKMKIGEFRRILEIDSSSVPYRAN